MSRPASWSARSRRRSARCRPAWSPDAWAPRSSAGRGTDEPDPARFVGSPCQDRVQYRGRGGGQGIVKFRVEREALGEAVGWVARALPARPVIPVLSGLLVQASGAGLTLSCFDYEVSARVAIPAEVEEPGTALVPGRLLAEII